MLSPRRSLEAAVAALFRQHADRLKRVAFAIVRSEAIAEDCVQEAFLRAYRAWPSRKPDTPAEYWLHRILVNVALSARRRETLRAVKQRLLGRAEPHPSPETNIERRDLQESLRSLTGKQAAAVVLHYYRGYTTAQTAAILGVSERALTMRLSGAVRRLRIALDVQKQVAAGEESPITAVTATMGEAR